MEKFVIHGNEIELFGAIIRVAREDHQRLTYKKKIKGSLSGAEDKILYDSHRYLFNPQYLEAWLVECGIDFISIDYLRKTSYDKPIDTISLRGVKQ